RRRSRRVATTRRSRRRPDFENSPDLTPEKKERKPMLKHAKQALAAVETTVRHPINTLTKHPVKAAAVVLGGFLLVDFLTAPHGRSYAHQALDKVLPKGGKHGVAGTFAPGWGRGHMPYMFGGHFPQSPAEITMAHNAWNAAAGHPQQYYSQ